MTLDEFIKKHRNEKRFFISSKSGWLFIGNREEYEKNIDKIDSRILDACTTAYIHTANREEYYRTEAVKVMNEDIPEEEKTRLAGEYNTKADRQHGYHIQIGKYLNDYTHLRQRQVKEKYYKDRDEWDDEYGLAVKIDGREEFDCWTNSEYATHKKILIR